MADKKISALTAATTPLAGTEVLPIVQGASTVKVSVADLTAGRSFNALGMTLTSTDAGATAAPLLDLYRDSASPAATDTLGEIEFNGEDSAGNKQTYGVIYGSILSPTSTAEQGQLHFETATAGALTEKMIIGTTNLVINEPGGIFNVRIEGDTDANLFYTDATNSRVGIGTSSPGEKLEVFNSGDTYIRVTGNIASGNAAGIQFYRNGGSVVNAQISAVTEIGNDYGVLRFNTAGASGSAERMRISSAGLVGLGTTAPAYQLQLSTDSAAKPTSALWTIASDSRIKTETGEYTKGLDAVCALRPITYHYNGAAGFDVDGKDNISIIAQEAMQHFPECVGTFEALLNEGDEEKTELFNWNGHALIFALVNAVKELKASNDALAARVNQLEGN